MLFVTRTGNSLLLFLLTRLKIQTWSMFCCFRVWTAVGRQSVWMYVQCNVRVVKLNFVDLVIFKVSSVVALSDNL